MKYDDGCTTTGWQFIPFAVSTFGTLGQEAEGLVAMMASYMGSLQLISDDEPDLLRQFKERISVAAMKAVGKQLLRVLSSIAYVPVIIPKYFWVVMLLPIWQKQRKLTFSSDRKLLPRVV